MSETIETRTEAIPFGSSSISKHTITLPFGGEKTLTLETGHIARQAHGTILARVGNTVVMANVVRSAKPLENADFFPLTVDYREKHYAVGRIPGNFFRREGRPSTAETINARLIDRTIRPLFPKGFSYDVQVYLTVLAMDQINPPSVVAINAATAALAISDIPITGVAAGARIGRVDGNLVVNPTFEERENGTLDLVVGGTKAAVTMVECGSKFLSEEQMLEALQLGHESVQQLVAGFEQLAALCGKEKLAFEEPHVAAEIEAAVQEVAGKECETVRQIQDKKAREEGEDALRRRVVEALTQRFASEPGEEPKFPNLKKQIEEAFESLFKKSVRQMILQDRVRADGRKLDEVRPIQIALPFLPLTHGSVLFTRGQTQSLGVVTLGTIGDQQKVDDLMGVSNERFLLHYNFPSYSVGETRRIMGPGRRELGHGMLAQRALTPILPEESVFPYTIRVVSEITESNGSSSMASVCSGCLSLMEAGVPIKAPVAGVAMGLIKEKDSVAILTDIMGMEDHLGDMDFKVAGTRDGITALQMDIKCDGLSLEIMREALEQARQGRLHILGKMQEALPEPRTDLSPWAPRIEIVKIDPERIGDLIGPSGKHIRGIQDSTGAKIDVQEDGTVFVCTSDKAAMETARQMVIDLTASPEVGRIYNGKVVRITDFGCFVEILPKKDGLVHVSELDFSRVEKVTDICREGDIIKVKCIEIDPTGRVRLSRKEALRDDPNFVPPPQEERSERPSRPPKSGGEGGGKHHHHHDRGGRDSVDRGGVDRGDRGDRGGRSDRHRH